MNELSFISPDWPPVVRDMALKWPAAIVARAEVGRFSGGLVCPRTLANLDSLRQGPAERVLLGQRKVAYPLRALCDWLADRVQVETRGGGDHDS